MPTKIDLAYIAGLVDGEAYIGIKRTPAYRCQGRTTPGYHARIQIRMVDEDAIRFLAEMLGGWYWREKPHAAKGRPLFCYQASDRSAEAILRLLLPFLRVKRSSAEAVLELRELQAEGKDHRTKATGTRSFRGSHGQTIRVTSMSFSDEYVARCDGLYERCKVLNRVGTA